MRLSALYLEHCKPFLSYFRYRFLRSESHDDAKRELIDMAEQWPFREDFNLSYTSMYQNSILILIFKKNLINVCPE